MQTHAQIKYFVRDTLGCSCPDEVFEKIEDGEDPGGACARKITIGDRLLIYILRTDGGANLATAVGTAIRQGVAERDARGLNRFRLVIAASDPDDLRGAADLALHGSVHTDEKTHLHVVRQSDIDAL